MDCGVWECRDIENLFCQLFYWKRQKKPSCKPVSVLKIPDTALGSYSTVKLSSEDALFRPMVSQPQDRAAEEGQQQFLKSFKTFSVTVQE